MKQNLITSIDDWIGIYAHYRSDGDKQTLRLGAELLIEHKRFYALNPALGRAATVATLHMDVTCILAALLCDLVGENLVNEQSLKKLFGDELVVLINQSLTALTTIDLSLRKLPEEEKHQQIEQLRRMLLAYVNDARVIIICLADRLQLLRQATSLEDAVRRELAQECRDIYAPLANRLGLGQIKWEMEDWSFRYQEPVQYHQIAKMLDERRGDREKYIEMFVTQLKQLLGQYGVKAEVCGRVKHIYSIWRKMQKKGQDFHQLFDIRAVRVLVDSKVACYTVLGIVHTQWQPIPGEFDDYIAVPKKNHYQSLHTAVMGPDNKTVEIQIRTHAMHEHAEFGVAAHWAYKEGKDKEGVDNRLLWLRGLIESLTGSGDESLSNELQEQLDEDRVYVLTPKGKILDFPSGATAVDFAYRIHTQVGHQCRGAKINGRMVPLNRPLQNADCVEVLTAKQGQPSRDWLNPSLGYVKTAKARAKIRDWFNKLDFDENIAAGRSALEKEFKRLNYQDVNFEQLARQLKMHADEMFAKLGRGELGAGQVSGLLGKKSDDLRQVRPRKKNRDGQIQIHGVGNLLIHLAACCKPVAHDPIIGFITQGRGVTVHRADCPNILRLKDEQRERLIAVDWMDSEKNHYAVDITIHAYQGNHLVKDITSLFTAEKIPIVGIQMNNRDDDHTTTIELAVEISGLEQLTRILAKINQIPNILQVQRR